MTSGSATAPRHRNPPEVVERLVEENRGLVFFHIGRTKLDFPDCDFDSVVSHAFEGLFRAAQLFDESLGFQFSTCASKWIRCGILRAAGLSKRQAVRFRQWKPTSNSASDLLTFVESEEVPPDESQELSEELEEVIREAALTEREEEVIRGCYFASDGATCRELSERLGLSRNRVSCLRKNALRKLRAAARRRAFRFERNR